MTIARLTALSARSEGIPMQSSSAFCRTQEALHTKRAAESALTNVRSIAMTAAAAWRAEGLLAEQREKRHSKRDADAAVLSSSTEDRAASENPDRGFADRF
jgi:hypothetical protein